MDEGSDPNNPGGEPGIEVSKVEGKAPGEENVEGEVMEEPESSIMEMEVDDSNTGDTITSNPEIDLGSAAAAATAVMIDEGDKTEPEEDAIIIVSTSSMAPTVVQAEVQSEHGDDEGIQSPTNSDEALESGSEICIVGSVRGSVDIPEKGDGDIEAMDVSEDASARSEMEDGAQVYESFGYEPAPENDEDIGEDPAEPESDPTYEPDPDNEFLHEEDSLSSMPEEADKENNGRDLAADDENEDDDGEYLEITRRRFSQDREGNCYCGKERNFNISELLCASCHRWFHESCIGYQLGKLVPFTTNYVFTCKNCSPTGLEIFRRNQAQFSQMCVTALANLTQQAVKDGTNIKLFSKDRDIVPFFEIHWEALTTTSRRGASSWHSTITKTLMKDAGTVYSIQEVPEDELSPYFGLLSDDLTQIRPNYEAMIKAGQLKITDQRNSSTSLRGRGAKRRTIVGDQTSVATNNLARKYRGDTYSKPIIGHGYPAEHPFNKDSYRYFLTEPDPNAPYRQEFDESNEWSGKPIHGWLNRVMNPPVVLLALHDRAPQLRVSDDRLSVTGEKGYCMIRATHGVAKGSWYFEAKITDMPEGSATRIGFCQQFGNLQGPLGFDRYGYSWRSRYGTTFHEAKGKSYAKGGYGLEDVLGFLIIMPESKDVPLISSFKDRPLVKVKSHLYYEDKDDPKDLDRRDARQGSKIICFKNGVCQGVAFEDIYCGTYYPAISLYKGITVRVNFGPDFEAAPKDHEYLGMCDRAEDSTIEHTMADLVYLTENDGRLKLDNAVPMPL